MAVAVVAACSDDRDSNPVVQQPESFVLNEPALSSNVYDLENSSTINVTYKQPDYGYTALVTYYAQVSLDNTWVEAASEEESASYVELEGSYSECSADLDANLINRAILTIGAYDSESDFPEQPMTIYVRMRATLQSGYECFSNVIALTVKAYYTVLTSVDPEMWYLVGGCIGDGTWGNSGISNIGTSLIPMSLVDGESYSATTGKGTLQFTGYFLSSQGFKLIKTPGSWDEQWGDSDGGIDSPVMNDGGSSNLTVPSDGYYTVTLNTNSNTLTVTAASDEPREYGQMMISGAFNDWATDGYYMDAVNTTYDVEHNHVWTYTLSAEEYTEVKFLVDSSWSPNWGAADFPYGFGASNGANIQVEAGDYIIIFNDVDGYYHFFDLNEE